MANLRDIRRRIKSVKNTAQITRAMQLVAAAKMKKAQDQAMSGRDYSSQLNAVLSDISSTDSEEATHPLLEVREGDRELVLVISTDKGLCGPLNTNLAKKLRATTSDSADFVTVGRKLRAMLEKDESKDSGGLPGSGSGSICRSPRHRIVSFQAVSRRAL